MKKFTAIGSFLMGCLLTLFICLPFIRTAQQQAPAAGAAAPSSQAAELKKTDHQIKIGLLQLVSHPSLDQIRQGIYDGLAKHGYVDGENIAIDFKNGQGDQTLLKTISDGFVADRDEVLVGIATPAAQALKNVAGETPVVFSGISDPVAAGLSKSLDKPGTNATGTVDATPVKEQLDLAKAILPDAKRMGILYSSSSTNVAPAVKDAKELAAQMGLTVVERTITNSNELAQTAEQLASETDFIFVPNDNTIASAMPTLIAATNAHKTPVFPVVDAMVAEGGLATVGTNQHQIGVDTAEVLVQVLEGKKPADVPVKIVTAVDVIVNSDAARTLGLTLPADVVKGARDTADAGGAAGASKSGGEKSGGEKGGK
ncbi:putative ABC transport system substrate-binding protein [Arcanobacterium wilhelmae]|uniref:ABC transport system substrate-binding protein n=1 Tax=Arcanobacterium wilhelmae TaxID=1803177 RepID=A0ABT9NBC1_9ACTO|nr:tryptophan ABC transporter substrate-binding protein [Arcanobacterium wilhelmae]MDP9801007.1 putative ABC transport system substrate-binding protein [Arcanobacterium wilhelmae]WFN90367.1 tryptophan ABC transporter substrate-binding protein [Arcanobacterium wilhelmae]